MSLCVHVCVSMSVCLCLCTFMYAWVYVCMYICVYTGICMCMCLYVYVWVNGCVGVSVCIFLCVQFTCLCVYTFIHSTYVHVEVTGKPRCSSDTLTLFLKTGSLIYIKDSMLWLGCMARLWDPGISKSLPHQLRDINQTQQSRKQMHSSKITLAIDS